MNERIYMSLPDVGEREQIAVVEAMKGGWIAPLGPDVDSFEAELAQRVGANYGVALSSGTAALHLGLLTLGVGPGDVVVTSTMTFAATTNAVMYTGAEPYFIDCLPDTGNMDPELLRQGLIRLRAEGRHVAAIVPVDLLGKAVDYSTILGIADEFEIPVLSDSAESLGANHRDQAVGSFGKASIFSFNGNKIMTTSGGGMLMTDDEQFANHVRYLATQARQPVVHYEHTDIGYNYRMSNLLAALGRAQLSRLDEMIAKRRAVRAVYKGLFSPYDGIRVFGVENDEDDNAWLTAIEIDESITGFTRTYFASVLEDSNIESRPLWKPMHLQPIYSRFGGELNGTAEHIFNTHLTLPSGSSLSDAQLQKIVDSIKKVLHTM